MSRNSRASESSGPSPSCGTHRLLRLCLAQSGSCFQQTAQDVVGGRLLSLLTSLFLGRTRQTAPSILRGGRDPGRRLMVSGFLRCTVVSRLGPTQRPALKECDIITAGRSVCSRLLHAMEAVSCSFVGSIAEEVMARVRRFGATPSLVMSFLWSCNTFLRSMAWRMTAWRCWSSGSDKLSTWTCMAAEIRLCSLGMSLLRIDSRDSRRDSSTAGSIHSTSFGEGSWSLCFPSAPAICRRRNKSCFEDTGRSSHSTEH